MFVPTFALGLVLLPFVSATVIDVQVGAGGELAYSPEAVAAQPGDQVVFHFNPKNHTVSQSSFANPCGLKAGGFNSGFMPVAANQSQSQPTFTITVNDTQPIWVYCAQAANTANSHCGQGMVFAVNCGQDGSTNSFTNFKNAALAIGASLSAAAASSTGAYGGAPAPTASWTTAAYGGYTIPAAPQVTPVTETITLGSDVWTTTYNSYPGSPNPTPAAAQGQVHTVVVGGSSLVFDPPFVAAQPRDTVVFEFHQKNHTVTQSAFADPCRPLNANGTTGFDSSFMPVGANVTSGFPTWSIVVNDTTPIWAYCKQTNPESHCGAGMVFAINPVQNSARNFTAFQNVAEALNGTQVAAVVPSSSPSPPAGSGAVPTRVGGAGLVVAVVAFVAAFL